MCSSKYLAEAQALQTFKRQHLFHLQLFHFGNPIESRVDRLTRFIQGWWQTLLMLYSHFQCHFLPPSRPFSLPDQLSFWVFLLRAHDLPYESFSRYASQEVSHALLRVSIRLRYSKSWKKWWSNQFLAKLCTTADNFLQRRLCKWLRGLSVLSQLRIQPLRFTR